MISSFPRDPCIKYAFFAVLFTLLCTVMPKSFSVINMYYLRNYLTHIAPPTLTEEACCGPRQSRNLNWQGAGENPFLPWFLPSVTLCPQDEICIHLSGLLKEPEDLDWTIGLGP